MLRGFVEGTLLGLLFLVTVLLVCAVGEINDLEAQLVVDPVRVHAIAALATCNYINETREEVKNHVVQKCTKQDR